MLLPSSFRDPSGYVFRDQGQLFRAVMPSYKADYDLLHSSGLYGRLVERGQLVSHVEVESADIAPSAYKVLKPDLVKAVSYPYEWCFSQLKDAAKLTLQIQKTALEQGMTLKDASAFNVQFHGGKPTLIDTLSFTKYTPGQSWVAYKQFCQHFLAPLALIAKVDHRLGKLSQVHIDGVPLDLASRLLPKRTKMTPGLMMHVHLHAKAQQKYADAQGKVPKAASQVSKHGLLAIIDNLTSLVDGFEWKLPNTEWGNYYDATNYTDTSLVAKEKIIGEMCRSLPKRPSLAIDLGANTGVFSRVLAEHADLVVAADVDPVAIEKLYRNTVAKKETNCCHWSSI